jgi:metallo-beta-lactamase family protein
MKIKFLGATETVTGSKHLLLTEKGKQILLDCGLYQGMGKETDEMNRKFGLAPPHIDSVILSHGHIDHSGNLPNLMKQGFRGKIYSTTATFDVCKLLLIDSAHIHEGDVEFRNKRFRKKGEPLIKPLYTVEDAERCLDLFRPVERDTDIRINDEISFYFSGNGHIIGSSAVNITAREGNKVTKLFFSGDIGRYSDPLLKPPSVFQQADHIICESTYGDKLHESVGDIEQKLLDIIVETCVNRKGRVVIPAFSLGRTQEILFVLDKLKNQERLPEVPMFVDSPLSSKVTAVVRKHYEDYNDELRDYIKKDPDPFGFPNLKYVEEVEESRKINEIKGPCVIIAASGMADAGRVKHHLRYTVSDERNTVLITGYCAPRSLGAKLLRGDKEVHIFGDFFEVKAQVRSILALSAHADYNEMIRFLSCQDKSRVKNIFLVHGEDGPKATFKEKLLTEGYTKVIIPEKGQSFTLD